MDKNISISSGSKFVKNFTITNENKKDKPAFVYNGKIFSKQIFNNNNYTVLLEDNVYYANHSLLDENIIIDYNVLANFINDPLIQNLLSEYNTLNYSDINPIYARSIRANSESTGEGSLSPESLRNPYDDNPPPPQCEIP